MVPVWLSSLGFSSRFSSNDPRQFHFRHLCPGEPVVFTRYDLAGRAQMALSIHDFHLPALTRGQLRVIEHPND